jgi:hypothetical protein
MQPVKIIAFPKVDNFKFILNKIMAKYDANLKNAVNAEF